MSIAVIAVVLHFKIHKENSKLNKADIFNFILETNLEETTVLLGESFKATPIMLKQATSSLHAFIEITTSSVNGEALDTLEPSDGFFWKVPVAKISWYMLMHRME